MPLKLALPRATVRSGNGEPENKQDEASRSGEWPTRSPAEPPHSACQIPSPKALPPSAAGRVVLRVVNDAWAEELQRARRKYGRYARSLFPHATGDAKEEASAIIALALFEVALVAAAALGVSPGDPITPPPSPDDARAFDLMLMSRIRALTRGALESRKVVALEDLAYAVSPDSYPEREIDCRREVANTVSNLRRQVVSFVSNLRRSATAYPEGGRRHSYLLVLADYASQADATSMTVLGARGGYRTTFVCGAIPDLSPNNEYLNFHQSKKDLDDSGSLRASDRGNGWQS